jgi:glycosyltransferase involved in cell wall biosynthesis
MHILFTLKDFKQGGGVERVQQRLAWQFLKDGRRVSFFVMNGETPGVEGAHVLDGGGHGVLGWLKSIVLLRRIIRREGVTHLIGAKEQANLCTWFATLGSRCRVIYTRHTALDSSEQKIGASSLRLLYALYLCGSGKVVTVSIGLHQTLARLMPWGRQRVCYCPNAVVTEQLHQASRAPMPADIPTEYWIGVARLVPLKGFHLMLDAYAMVLRERAVPDLVIVGDGPERDALLAQAQQLGIADRVHFTGLLDNPYALIRHARLLILSSLHEGLPTVVIEALALGTPVLASDCAEGLGQLLDHGRLGRLVQVNDVQALAQGMRQSIDAHAPCPRGAIQAMREFTSEHSAMTYYQVWNQ